MGECCASADRERCAELSAPSRISLDWKGVRKFEGGREGRPPILLDGDGEAGPTPPDALLAALGACVSVDVVDILSKRRTPVESYSVEVLGERVDTIPRRFRHITLNISIVGAGIERAVAGHAIDLAITKYCSVCDSLQSDIQIVWNLALNGKKATEL